VDRLTFGGHLLETSTQSYRFATTLARQSADPEITRYMNTA